MLKAISTIGNFGNVTLTSTDAGAGAGPLLDLYRNSASPAASDTIGEIEFNGQDSAGNKQQYAVIHASILSPTSTAETGQIHFETATGGASTEKMIIGTSNLVINEIGAVFNVRIEGDTDANLFFTDATNSRVGIGILTPAEKLDVVGNIKLTGNVIPASGFGIDFSATSHPAGMTSELLADYEEGSYTATVTPQTSGTITLNVNQLSYTKIGRTVLITGYLNVSSVSLPVGAFVNINLPFTIAGANTGADRKFYVGGAATVYDYTVSNFIAAPIYAFEGSSNVQVYYPVVATAGGTIINLSFSYCAV